MKGIVATLCLVFAFLLVVLTGCEETPKKPAKDATVKAQPTTAKEKKAAEQPKTAPAKVKEAKPAEKPKAPPAEAEKKPAEKPKTPVAKAKEKKPAEKPQAPPAKVEEKKPAEKTEAPPVKAVEKKVAQAPKGEEKPALVEEKKAPPKPAEGAEEKPAAPPKPVMLSFDAEQKVWMIDDFEKERNWRAEKWDNANPATVNVIEADGGKALQVVCEPGESDKSAVSRSLPLDMTSRGKLLVDVRSDAEKEIKLAVAFLTQGNVFFESKPSVIKPGLNKDVAFDLKAPTFKSAATEWAHSAALSGADQVRTLYFVIYGGAGKVTFDNVRLATE